VTVVLYDAKYHSEILDEMMDPNTAKTENEQVLVREIENLRKELSISHAFHDVAVKERDLERLRLYRLQEQLDRLSCYN
jgi:alcohol dehydrogenase class IV